MKKDGLRDTFVWISSPESREAGKVSVMPAR